MAPNNINMKTVLHFAIGCLIIAYIVVAFLAYSLFWPIRTLELQSYDDSHPIQILNTVVHPGEALQYKLSYCKYTDIPSVVHRNFIDGQVITLTDTVGQFPRGCHLSLVDTAIVPSTINAGKYYLDVVVEYDLNPFRKEFIHYRTTYFTVVR